MVYRFTQNVTHTLGVEIELQLIDEAELSLANAAERILSRVPEAWKNSIKPELMRSYCELNSGVCTSVGDVLRDLGEKLDWTENVAREEGLRLTWAGTHPFSPWRDQEYTPDERYRWLSDSFQDVTRRLVVFGLHVHVGVDSGDKAVQLCDRMLRHLPALLALSANSPMWNGRDTGLASYRTKIMEALPTAGLPQPMRNWSEYVWLIEHLRETRFLRSVREIWWDVRPHHEFGTIEIRIMDMPMNMRHLAGLVALTQSLVASISKEIDRGAYQYDCHPMIAKQNKWQAARYGLEAPIIDPDTLEAFSARDTVRRLVELCSPAADALGCLDELASLDDLLDNGTGADRQRAVFVETGSMFEVVRYLVEASALRWPS